MSPPADSPIVLRPEASGAWCYYNTALGTAEWHPPDGSMQLSDHQLVLTSIGPHCQPPPRLPRTVGLGCLTDTPWIVLYQDSDSRVLLFHRLTGAIREAPWIALRTFGGRVYFAKVVTRETSWFPPPLWMAGWVMRPQCQADYTVKPAPRTSLS